MDPQASTSFIPKEALTAERARGRGVGLFFLISLLIFIVSVVAAAGAFGYARLLDGKLADDKVQLEARKGAFDPATIQDLVRIDNRIEQAKQLLSKHVAPSAIFDFLSQKTLVNVQFTGLSYTLGNDGSASIQMDGTADSFATIALQSDALGKSTSLKDVIFSNIAVGQTGRVSFTVQATVEPALISYAKNLNGTAPQQ